MGNICHITLKEGVTKNKGEMVYNNEVDWARTLINNIWNNDIKETITVPAGRTYFYDGKFAVQTTKPHTTLDRYVTLRLIEGSGNVYILHREDYSPSRLHLFDYVYLSHGAEFWGEIDRCHMVRKTPIETRFCDYESIIICEEDIPSQTSRGKNAFNQS